jgi:mannonate dehydratase
MNPMTRRRFACCTGALGVGLFTGLSLHAAKAMPWTHPCRGPLPAALAQHPLVLRAFEGIDPSALWDVHAHLLGVGDAGSGCSVHPSLQQPWHPVEWMRRRVILNAACVPGDAPSVDHAYVAELLRQADEFPEGARWLLFAFERAHDDAGRPRDDWSTFHVPNAYAAAVAAAHPQRFGWVASVHPYRADALARLDQAAAGGALAMKWLPSAMNIDLADPRCRPFYDRLRRHGLPLVVHCGEEHAVPGARRDAYGNPLLVRHALQAGVRVVIAHAASLGAADDIDRRSRPRAAAFDLYARLMDERAHQGLLWADVSAVFQSNRQARVMRTLLRRDDWHPRLLHGSDHPLPGVMPLFRPDKLHAAGLLDAADVLPLQRLREHNPLLFDFVLKRSLRDGGARLAPLVFATRRLWQPGENRAA